MLERIWNDLRRRFCPKRLYRWGTVGLAFYDDRIMIEKMCDRVDDYWLKRRDERRYERAYQRQQWHSFFSLCLGGVVSSSEQIRNYEKRGYAWARPEEFEAVADKAQKRIEAEQNKRIRDKVEYAAGQIKQGRSYIKEQRERIEKLRRA